MRSANYHWGNLWIFRKAADRFFPGKYEAIFQSLIPLYLSDRTYLSVSVDGNFRKCVNYYFSSKLVKERKVKRKIQVFTNLVCKAVVWIIKRFRLNRSCLCLCHRYGQKYLKMTIIFATQVMTIEGLMDDLALQCLFAILDKYQV